MGIIIKYVVERNGEERMTFTSKADADAYDKMLDMADDLCTLLGDSKLVEDENQREELSVFLAQNREEVLQALGVKRKVVPKKKKIIEEGGNQEENQDPTEENIEAA